jgi:1-acyl-sn-glycerol-3-phosphate acyltransferase
VTNHSSSTEFAESKAPGVLEAPLAASGGRRPAALDTLRLYLGYALLGVICLTISLLALPMSVLPRALSRRLGRHLISSSARVYLRLLALMGACRFDLCALDALRDAPSMVIAPNHPCLLDALMILAALPGATCVMKAGIVNSVFFGAAARVAGLIRNTPLRTMVHSAVGELRQGSHVLLFPEGTRTTCFPVGPLQGTTGLIAKKAGVPVQTVFIETDSGFLGKGWPILRTPRMPITYRIRLGKRFDPPVHTGSFVSELEQYFQCELAQAQLPSPAVARH